MKAVLYISGITGTILLVFRLLGVFLHFPANDILLISGLILTGLIFLPCYIIDKYLQARKIENIIKNYEGRKKQPIKTTKGKEAKPKIKGWDMNNSPFRERKSGLTWGGGNIKGATAQRGTGRTFLR